MTKTFEDIPSSTTLKDSREMFLDRDNAARTMNSGTSYPTITDETYEDMLGMPVFRTDTLVNQQFTEYDESTSTATWTPIVSGPSVSVDENIVSFDGTSGGIVKDSGSVLPTTDVAGTTDTQTLENKTFSGLDTPLAIADGGTGQITKTAACDALSPLTTKGEVIVHDGTNNTTFSVGTDGQVLAADSSTTTGLAWVAAAEESSGSTGLELSVEDDDFTAVIGKLHYIDSSDTITVTLPASVSAADRFAVVTGDSSFVLIFTNASATAQTMIGAGYFESVSSSSSSVNCGSIDKKMSYVEFNAVSSSQFIGYVNYLTTNNYSGYFAGGNVAAGADVIERLSFADDSVSTISATLIVGRSAGCSYSSAFCGYVVGGQNYSTYATIGTIEKIFFSSETVSAVTDSLSTARKDATGVNSETRGYVLGGFTTTQSDVIDALVFSNDVNSAITAVLPSASQRGGGAQSSTNGYFLGGYPGSATTAINKLVFSSEACASISETISVAKYGQCGISSSIAGFIGGGWTSTSVTTIEKFVFSTESDSVLSAVLTTASSSAAGFASSLYGYFGALVAPYQAIDQLTFSTDTNSAISATLTATGHYSPFGFNN